MKLFVIFVIATIASAEVNASCTTYADFKGRHGKKYGTAEDLSRQKQWQSSCSKISAHNALYAKGQVSYQLDDNFMADLTDAERQKYMGSSKPSPRSIERIALPMDRAFPATLNLTTSKCMPAIKNQGICGSAWAFAAVNPIEYQLCNKTGKLTLLSEQQLVSCYDPANNGCNGGYFTGAWLYIFAAGGLTSSAVSPYTAKASNCTFKKSTAVVNLSGISYLFPNETMIQQAVFYYGPVSVNIWANNNFILYSKGIFKDPTCRNDGRNPNHAITLVGYGTDAKGGPFWIARNQWGTGWGQRGYIQMARGVNLCGLADYAYFPTIYA